MESVLGTEMVLVRPGVPLQRGSHTQASVRQEKRVAETVSGPPQIEGAFRGTLTHRLDEPDVPGWWFTPVDKKVSF